MISRDFFFIKYGVSIRVLVAVFSIIMFVSLIFVAFGPGIAECCEQDLGYVEIYAGLHPFVSDPEAPDDCVILTRMSNEKHSSEPDGTVLTTIYDSRCPLPIAEWNVYVEAGECFRSFKSGFTDPNMSTSSDEVTALLYLDADFDEDKRVAVSVTVDGETFIWNRCGERMSGVLKCDEGSRLDPDKLLINLGAFRATNLGNRILAEWATYAELDNAGFFLHRSDSPDGEFVRLNPVMIPSSSGSDISGMYSYTDHDMIPGKKYFYKLEDLDYSGKSTFHGPVEAFDLLTGDMNGDGKLGREDVRLLKKAVRKAEKRKVTDVWSLD